MFREQSELDTIFWFLAKFFKQSFVICASALFILLIIEDVKQGFVLNYFGLRQLFIVCIVLGLFALVLSKPSEFFSEF